MSRTCSENTIDSNFNYLEQNNQDIITSRMKTREKIQMTTKKMIIDIKFHQKIMIYLFDAI